MKDNYGVVYYSFGNKFPNDLERSVASIRKHNEGIKIAWITETPNHPKKALFDVVIKSVSKKRFGWHRRTESLVLSPFDITLHLDSDTVVNGDLTYGFEKADKFGLAICHAPAYYSKQFFKTTSHDSITPINDKQPVYNCGMFFYKKGELTGELFKEWSKYNDKCVTMQDQCGFSNAVEGLGINPYVLTKSWNFRGGLHTEGHGPITIWHSHNNIPTNKANNEGFFKI